MQTKIVRFWTVFTCLLFSSPLFGEDDESCEKTKTHSLKNQASQTSDSHGASNGTSDVSEEDLNEALRTLQNIRRKEELKHGDLNDRWSRD